MKFLKYTLIFVVVLVLLFFGKGLLTPTISYENEITVNKSAKEAWAVMNDETNLPKWIEGFKRVEPVSGTPNTVGAVSNVYVEDQGQEMVIRAGPIFPRVFGSSRFGKSLEKKRNCIVSISDEKTCCIQKASSC